MAPAAAGGKLSVGGAAGHGGAFGSGGTGGASGGAAGGANVECADEETRQIECSAAGPRTLQPQRCVAGVFQDEGPCICPEGAEYDELADACLAPLACDELGAPFGGGEGTEDAPYRICSGTQLQAIGGALGSHFVLAKSLDLSSVTGFIPLGNEASAFTGALNGGRRALVGLKLNGEELEGTGLFGQMEGAKINDLMLVDFEVKGQRGVGALVGQAREGSRIEQVAVKGGTILGTSHRVGGLAGRIIDSTLSKTYSTSSVEGVNLVGGLVASSVNSTISESYAAGSVLGADTVGGLSGRTDNSSAVIKSYATGGVQGNDAVGGLVGYHAKSTVNESYASGSVKGNDYVGGLVGRSDDDFSTITRSYAIGRVEGKGFVGGLVGRNAGSSVLSDSYSLGDVKGTNSVGGLVGWNVDSAKISESYTLGRVEGSTAVGGIVGRNQTASLSASFGIEQGAIALWGANTGTITSSQLLPIGDFSKENIFVDADWDFLIIWVMSAGLERPVLRWQAE